VSNESVCPKLVGYRPISASASHRNANADTIAEMIVTFFVGLSLEQNLKEGRMAARRKIKNLMGVIHSL